jgi:hypothetical protein
MRFNERLSDEDKVEFGKRNAAHREFDFFRDTFSAYCPSMFFVVHYDHFGSTLKDLLAIFKDPSLDDRADRRHLKVRTGDHSY